MVQISNSVNDYRISNSGINQDDVQNTIVKSKQAVSDNFESNSLSKAVSGSITDPKNMRQTLLVIPPLYFLDRYFDKLIGKEAGKGLLDKTAKLGDTISHTLRLDKIISEKNGSKISQFIKNNRFTKYFTSDYKAIPKVSLAKGSTLADKYSQEIMTGLSSIKHNYGYSKLFTAGEGALGTDTVKLMESIGPLKQAVTPQYLESVRKSLLELIKNAKSAEDKEAAVNLLKNIAHFIEENPDATANVSTEKLAGEIASVLSRFKNKAYYGDMLIPSAKTFSNETMNILHSVASKTTAAANPSQVINAVDDVIAKGVKETSTKGLMSKNINLNELANKLKAADSKLGETVIGKTFAKTALKTKDLLTFGGGLLGLYFAANGLLQAIKATKEAPKGEKKSTFMHVLSEQYVGILLFQPSINLLYKLGGNKYRGMTVEGRKALQELIEKANSNPNLTKEGYKIAKMQKDLLLRGVNKDEVAKLTGKGLNEAKNLFKTLKNSGTKVKLWEKPLKFAGRILDAGLDKIKSPTFFGKMGGKVKGFAGGLGRFLIIMMVLQPILQKPVTKLCHKIFGTPTTYLEKHGENKDDKKAKKKKPVNTEEKPQTNDKNSTNNEIAESLIVPKQKIDENGTNLLQRYISQNNSEAQDVNASQPIAPQRQSDEIAAFNLFKKNDSEEKTYSYVPSIKVDNSYYDKLLKANEKEADAFIKQKNKELKKYLK